MSQGSDTKGFPLFNPKNRSGRPCGAFHTNSFRMSHGSQTLIRKTQFVSEVTHQMALRIERNTGDRQPMPKFRDVKSGITAFGHDPCLFDRKVNQALCLLA